VGNEVFLDNATEMTSSAWTGDLNKLKRDLETERKNSKLKDRKIECLEEELSLKAQQLTLADKRIKQLIASRDDTTKKMDVLEERVKVLTEEAEMRKDQGGVVVERCVVPEAVKELIKQGLSLLGTMKDVASAVDKEDAGPWLKTTDGMRCQEETIRVVKEDHSAFPADSYDCYSVLDTYFGQQEVNDERVILPPHVVEDGDYQVMQDYDNESFCIGGQVRLSFNIFSLLR
jgi:hypothetical protein